MGDVVMTISIGDYSVDNIKYFEDHEGIDIFKCDILYNNKKIGTFSEDYMCGPSNYNFNNNFDEELTKLRKTATSFFNKYSNDKFFDDEDFFIYFLKSLKEANDKLKLDQKIIIDTVYPFDYTIEKAEIEDNTIKKVLPGVEFSVQFSLDNSISPIHIIAIFSDLDDEKVKKIAEILDINNPSTGGAYSEEEFLSILREIDIDTILIAHQKNSLSSQKPRKNDANSLGKNKFLEFVYSDYFEAFEFKNKRNEILNKNFLLQENLEDSLRFVTGTDCHDWSIYPREDHSDNVTDFPYTYAKCLPTFKGLVMAITDSSRLKLVNSFFNVDKFVLENIKIKNNIKNS